MKIKLSFFLLLISVAVFSQNNSTAQLYKTKTFEAAIFPVGNVAIFLTSDFTPSHTEVDLAEKALTKDLEKLNQQYTNQSDTPVIHKKLKKYSRQYLGYIDTNGDRILFINCLWKNDDRDENTFLTQWIETKDGCSYYWNIKYNITKNKLFDLTVNGCA